MYIILFIQPLSKRHSHSHQINHDSHEENQSEPPPSTSRAIYTSQSIEHSSKSQPISLSSPSSLSSSLLSLGEHGKHEQMKLLSKQKKSSSSQSNNSLTHMNDCCSAHSTPDTMLKIHTTTVRFADSTTSSSSTKQSPLSSQFEHNAHNIHDTQRSVHVI